MELKSWVMIKKAMTYATHASSNITCAPHEVSDIPARTLDESCNNEAGTKAA